MSRSHRGAAMLAALAFLVVASGIIVLMFTSTLSEIRHSGDDVAIVQTLTLARGGANMGGKILQDSLRDELQRLSLLKASTVERFPFGSSPEISDPEPTAKTVITDLTSLINDLQKHIDAQLCSAELNPSPAQKVSVKVYLTNKACDHPLPSDFSLPAARYVSGQPRTYAIPFVLVATAQIGSSYTRSIASQGEYQFTVGGGKFSQYAHFSNRKRDRVWFTSDTIFDGRVHTNETFNLAFKPWFGSKVSSAGCTQVVSATAADSQPTTECALYEPGVNFYSDRAFRNANDIGDPPQSRNGQDRPSFEQGVDWEADYVSLPQDALKQKTKAGAKGLKKEGDFYSLTLFAGDTNGHPLRKDQSGAWLPQASHQYIELCQTETACERYRYSDDKKLYKQSADGSWRNLPELLVQDEFNGLIYLEGKVDRFKGPGRTPADSNDAADAPPALAAFATLTVVPTGDIRITGDLTYENPPCSGILSRDDTGTIVRPPCNDLNVQNILGVYAPEENILIGHKYDDATLNAPDTLTLHGSYMTAKGSFTTENLGGILQARESINVLGGIIQEQEGSVGRVKRDILTDGYRLNITFDQRMALDYAPPFFPGTSPAVIQGIFIYSYGQREQVF